MKSPDTSERSAARRGLPGWLSSVVRLAATAGLTVLGVALFFVEGRAVETVTERGGVVEAP